MSFSKWIGAAIGWSLGGPIGAILGMALGSVVDGFSNGSIKVDTQNPYARRRQTKSGDFEVSLLILSSIVIKADGKQPKGTGFCASTICWHVWKGTSQSCF